MIPQVCLIACRSHMICTWRTGRGRSFSIMRIGDISGMSFRILYKISGTTLVYIDARVSLMPWGASLSIKVHWSDFQIRHLWYFA